MGLFSVALVLAPWLAAAEEAALTQGAPPAPLKWVEGPRRVDLGHQFALDLPAGWSLLEKAEAASVLLRMGNRAGEGLMALVVHGDDDWFVEVSHEDTGYVKDDEAEKLDGDAILEDIKEGTAAANDFRKENGFAEVFVDGWVSPPAYERATHRMTWGIQGHSERGVSVNFNTRVLGRHGVVSMNLIASPDGLAAAKPFVLELLKVSGFDEGARYRDFQPGKDRVAEFGLAALVAGGAGAAALKAGKIGLLAVFLKKFGVILLAGKKFIVIGLVALVGAFRLLFGRRKDEPAAGKPPEGDPPAPT